LAKHSEIQSEITSFEILRFKPLTISLVTQQIALCFLYCFSGLCQAVLLLTYVVATRIWSYPELDPWNIIHILGFITRNFKPIWIVIIATFHALIWMRVGIGKCLTCIQIRHIVRLFEF
jgi:hypothetical protein